MSLSKPFRLLDLPLLPLEQVLLLTEPKDLFFFALSSEKAWELLRIFSLVKYFDINVWDTSVIFWIGFQSGEPIGWKFTMELPVNAYGESRRWANRELLDGRKQKIGVLDGMRMIIWESKFELPKMRCNLPKEHFVDYTQRIGYFLQSICPGQRIRELKVRNVGWEDEKVLFPWNGITKCDELTFDMYNGDNLLEILEKTKNFLEIMEKTEVKRKICLVCKQELFSNLEWMNNEKIRNIPKLELICFNDLSLSQFLSFQNEQLHIAFCSVKGIYLNEYLKKWMNGEFTKRRTLIVTNHPEQGFDDTVLNGLTQEPLETWEKLGKPGHVRFSNKLFLKPISRTVPMKYRAVLLKNCHGQFATVVQTLREFYFTPWDHPLPPIDIPKGHRLCESSVWPFAVILPQNVEFSDHFK